MNEIILHVATASDFERPGAEYWPDGFLKEGFIHACSDEQLEGVLARYFAGVNDLYLLEVDSRLLQSPLKREASGSGEFFPHIYGKINRDAIVKVIRIR